MPKLTAKFNPLKKWRTKHQKIMDGCEDIIKFLNLHDSVRLILGGIINPGARTSRKTIFLNENDSRLALIGHGGCQSFVIFLNDGFDFNSLHSDLKAKFDSHEVRLKSNEESNIEEVKKLTNTPEINYGVLVKIHELLDKSNGKSSYIQDILSMIYWKDFSEEELVARINDNLENIYNESNLTKNDNNTEEEYKNIIKSIMGIEIKSNYLKKIRNIIIEVVNQAIAQNHTGTVSTMEKLFEPKYIIIPSIKKEVKDAEDILSVITLELNELNEKINSNNNLLKETQTLKEGLEFMIQEVKNLKEMGQIALQELDTDKLEEINNRLKELLPLYNSKESSSKMLDEKIATIHQELEKVNVSIDFRIKDQEKYYARKFIFENANKFFLNECVDLGILKKELFPSLETDTVVSENILEKQESIGSKEKLTTIGRLILALDKTQKYTLFPGITKIQMDRITPKLKKSDILCAAIVGKSKLDDLLTKNNITGVSGKYLYKILQNKSKILDENGDFNEQVAKRILQYKKISY